MVWILGKLKLGCEIMTQIGAMFKGDTTDVAI